MYRTRKVRRLLLAVFMLASMVVLLSAGALGLPNSRPAAAVVAGDFCADCAQQCWNDANTGTNNAAYWRCRDNGGSQDFCTNTVTLSYYNNCVSVYCNYLGGCSVAPKPYRFCKTGDC